METRTIIFKGSEISYRIKGQGKSLVLLHGFAEDSAIWNDLIGSKEFPTNYSIILPDIPGSGKSELLTGTDISISTYAECLKAILDKEGITECTLIGHSMGGYIALAFAEKYGSMLNRLGLFHSSAFADDEEKKAARRKAIEFIKDNGPLAFLKTSLPGLFTDGFKQNHPEVVEALIERGKSFTGEALIQYYNAMINRPDTTEVLKTFPHSILFIIGEKDIAIPFQASLKQCHLPKISDVNILSDVGHMGMLEATDKCACIITTFLNRP
jgi:pimeloyl-ACP methyl ester carboxylesterase